VDELAGKSGCAGKIAATTVDGPGLGEYEWKKFLPLAFGGHCYYCRQDLTGDQWGKSVMQREIGGIAIPDSAADRCLIVTVLGIGPQVGMPTSKEHKIRYECPDRMAIVDGVKVGDRLMIVQEPGQTSVRLKRSPLNWQDEVFIEESLPDAIVEDE